MDGSGNVYVADTYNYTIRKITPEGVVSTLAGLAGSSGSADGTGSAARFNYAQAAWPWTASGNVYVADSGNNTIRKITPAGVVSTLAGLAGTPGSADGTGSAARFCYPYGVAVDGSGNVYVADSMNYTIRKITPAGVVSTLAGWPGSSGSTDGTGSAARFDYPTGVAVDGSGNVYVADTDNYTIRKITPAGVVSTLAGLAGTSGSADGTGSAARFDWPHGVAVDGSGNVYVADTGNYTIRMITPAGVVSTLAGTAGSSGSADGTGSAARFNYPYGVAVDGSGNVYVADCMQQHHPQRRSSIADAATIDQATGPVGSARQLDTNPQTASSWQWSIIRSAQALLTPALSSTTIRNPTFTPDVADLYIFQLLATDASGRQSITTVQLAATPGNQTITLEALSAKTYGDADFDPGATASSGLAVSYSSSDESVAKIVNGLIHVVAPGTATITASQAGDSNWNAASDVQQSLAVNQAVLTVTADAQSMVYGAALPTLTCTITGYQNGNDASVITGTPTLSTTASTSSPVGSYPITVDVSGMSATNYAFSSMAGALMVNQAPLAVTADAQSKVYGAANPTMTYTYTGLVNNDASATFAGALATTATTGLRCGKLPNHSRHAGRDRQLQHRHV